MADTKEWQACSNPELAACAPEALFEALFAGEYRRLHADIWQRLIDLNGTLGVLQTLEAFPFIYVYGSLPEFWRLVIANFAQMVCVLMHGLLNDQEPDAHTLRRFKNRIMQATWTDPAKRNVLQRVLEQREFDKCITDIADRVTLLRHTEIAHRIVPSPSRAPTNVAGDVSLAELRRLYGAIHAMFGALSFGTAYVTLAGDFIPRTRGGKALPTSLDEVLDALLRESEFVNEPERDPCWCDTRSVYDADHLRVMNECRARIGLLEV